VLTDAEFRHGLFDPDVAKQRVTVRDRGLYVDVVALEEALRQRNNPLDEGELDRYVKRIGAVRVERGELLPRLGLRSGRGARYFLPEISYQRVRQRRLR
jgi:hypothetical protein